MNEKAFTSSINEINESNLKRLNSEGISEEFKSLEKENLKFDSYLLLNSYERNHSYYAKKEGFKVSDKFLPEDLKNMVYDNASYYANFEAYQRLASSKVMDDLFEDIGDNFQSVSPEQLAIIAKSPILALKNEIAKSIGVFLISPGNPNMEGVYTFFDGITSNDEVKRELKKKFEINKKLLPGMDSPTFTDYENHAGGSNSLEGGSNSLEDYKGKFVYVDVWATWCGPCKREIPYLKDIENEYHGKNIVFLSTSIDRAVDYDKWKKMVKDEELQGVQLLADSDWQSQFVTEYAINGIPRFLLIDPEGKIVSADAPRPSNPKLKELFNKLNI
jgi:thiol-disulfide isomerase/thioredoxin